MGFFYYYYYHGLIIVENKKGKLEVDRVFEDMTCVVKVELDVIKRTKKWGKWDNSLDSQPSLCVFVLYFVRILRVCTICFV